MAESRHRYLFERLGDHDFQQLVGALLVRQFPDYTPMALRQADGGRDGIRRDAEGRVLVYQVKWSGTGSEKDPVAWLDEVVRRDEASLRRLAAEGVRHYALVTNVPSTASPGSGTMDRLNEKLERYAEAFGYELMTCFWRESLTAWVDSAPTETKWAYADMLAGWDLVRYLVTEHVGAAKDKGIRDLVRKVVASQWEDDRRVKFSQSDIDRQNVAELFVDVTAELVHSPAGGKWRTPTPTLGGAAAYLLSSSKPFTLVRGAPGQGKSTLSQYVCQTHRNSFMPRSERMPELSTVDEPRFPIRLDLSEYALWLGGRDVWEPTDERAKPRSRRRTGDHATVECFLADLLAHESGQAAVGADVVHEVFARVPSLVVLDGLDEVGAPAVRAKVVKEIDKFVARGRTYDVPPQIVVTTRPSADALPEPSSDLFEVITLNQLTSRQRDTYLRKWCAVRGIRGRDGRALRESFKAKSREPYLDELAGNPMQLTILLDLLHRQGAAAPTQRTDLYDTYVDLLLAREANKHPKAVREHREELLEIIPFLGWYLHAHTEASQINGRMSIDELKAAMRHFQRTYGNPESVVDELFEGASDRLWALTSKMDGTYEFEVLSLREYFAARFLYRNAGDEESDFDSTTVLRELIRRPYWLNTARFYGGNAKDRDIFVLAGSIEEELVGGAPAASFLAAWALLTDGVFQRRPRQARRVIAAVCSDEGLDVLLMALHRLEISPLPELPTLLEREDGPDPTWARLTALILADPAAPQSSQRVVALRELLNQRDAFATWWYEQLLKSAGQPEQTAWLKLGAECEVAAGRDAGPDSGGLDLSGDAAEDFLNTGLVPRPGSRLEASLMQSVLDGLCPDVRSVRSLPAQVAAAFSPHCFFADSGGTFAHLDEESKRLRSLAIQALRKARSPYADIAKKRAIRAGYKNSTFPWVDTATALLDHAGRCWLVAEIAIMGAASPFLSGRTKTSGATAFGRTGHPSELLAQTRAHVDDALWWREQLGTVDDDLGRAEWALALWSVASGKVVSELLPLLEGTLDGLPSTLRRTVLRAAVRMSTYRWYGKGQITSNPSDPWLSGLADERNGLGWGIPDVDTVPGVLRASSTTQPPLLHVARANRWFKVDTQPTYQ